MKSIIFLLSMMLAVNVFAEQAKDLGAEIYHSTCALCHGKDGKGAIPGAVDFTSKDGPLIKKTKKELFDNVWNGFQTPGSPMPMPPKGGNPKLTKQQIEEVLAYINKTFKPKVKKDDEKK